MSDKDIQKLTYHNDHYYCANGKQIPESEISADIKKDIQKFYSLRFYKSEKEIAEDMGNMDHIKSLKTFLGYEKHTIDISKEFNSLSDFTNTDHNYLKKKKITTEGCYNLKQDRNKNIIIPLYSIKSFDKNGRLNQDKIISWQTIIPKKSKEGKDKFFKSGCSKNGGVYYTIGLSGKDNKTIYICEGFATGCSIYKITECMVYCAFTKGDLDKVVALCKSKYSDYRIVLCLDNDDKNTHQTKEKTDQVVVLCPNEKGDFNDFQNDQKEIDKLTKLTPVYETPIVKQSNQDILESEKAENEDFKKKIGQKNLSLVNTQMSSAIKEDKAKNKKQLRIISANDPELLKQKSLGFLIPGWIPEAGSFLLTADKGVGKSFVFFKLSKLLTSAKQDTPLGYVGGLGKGLYCFIEGDITKHRDRWNAIGGNPDKLDFWGYNPKERSNWNDLNILDTALKTHHYSHCILDRADIMIKGQITKERVRDSQLMIDQLGLSHKIPVGLSRHTSKPIGKDNRAFDDQTDGFKEWQHTSRICLMIIPREDGILIFKQYANDCSTNGLIKLKWESSSFKDTDGNLIVIPKFDSYFKEITKNQIEERYNSGRKKPANSSENYDLKTFAIKNYVIQKTITGNKLTGNECYTFIEDIFQVTSHNTKQQLLFEAGYLVKKIGKDWLVVPKD